MKSKTKSNLTRISKIPAVNSAIEKLTKGDSINYADKVFLLSIAMQLFKEYENDRRNTSYAEFAYFIILNYSLNTGDYRPLLEYSTNFGLYPITRAILEDSDYSNLKFEIVDEQLTLFEKDDYVETFEQKNRREKLLNSEDYELAYIAPTSYGKSSVIVEYIKNNPFTEKVGIIVPSKSLLVQTYKMIRDSAFKRKIILHDEMYNNEESFIAILTQERALRILAKNDLKFDLLFIDEAHNVLKGDDRAILLSRLLAKSQENEINTKFIYLSPLLESSSSIKISEQQEIIDFNVKFNIKEPKIFELKHGGGEYIYNRFLNKFYHLQNHDDIYEYAINKSGSKNFLFANRPIHIELLSSIMSNKLPIIEDDRLTEIQQILRTEVHPDFYLIKHLSKGLAYIHGQIPDNIKEYIESKFKEIDSLKYLVANVVILEGINLPIDKLFIFNMYRLQGKELTNLIGRVNRLNYIFSEEGNNLNKLTPEVHFLNNTDFNSETSNMANKIQLLRSSVFKDEVKNPTLASFDISKVSPEKREKINQIIEHERFISEDFDDVDEDFSLLQKLIESGISQFYNDITPVVEIILERIKDITSNKSLNEQWFGLNFMERVYALFIFNIEQLSDEKLRRLVHVPTRNYYYSFITINSKRSLKENVLAQFKYWRQRAKDGNPLAYIGSSYGEIPYDENSFQRLYIDINRKKDPELINLCVIKLKMEDNFVRYTLNKLIVFLHDNALLTDSEYNEIVYGTNDEAKIALTKYGFSISLLNALEKENQLKNIRFDEYNNAYGNTELYNWLSSQNDLFQFEVKRLLG